MKLHAEFFGGVFIAISAGMVLNLGSLIQKKAVNQIVYIKKKAMKTINDGVVDEDKLNHVSITVKDLAFSKLWVLGFLLQAVVGAGLFIVAQAMIGPSLTPALGSIGLVVLVFASCIVDERLTWDEYIGLVVMIGAVFLLGFSDMVIDINTDFLQKHFIIRVAVYTIAVIVLCIICKLWSFRRDRFEGPALAVLAGLLVALQNYWIGPFTALAGAVFRGGKDNITWEHHGTGFALLYFFVSMALVIVSNLQTVYERQLAFRIGGAATMIPISHLPSHLSSPIIYSYVFNKTAPHHYSLPCMWAGLVLLLVCSIIFGKRGAQFEEKHEDDGDPESGVRDKLISASA